MASLNQGTNLQFFPYNEIVQSEIWVSYFVVFDVKEEEHSNQLLLCHICAMYISLIVCNPLIPTDSSKSHLGSDMPSALGLVSNGIGNALNMTLLTNTMMNHMNKDPIQGGGDICRSATKTIRAPPSSLQSALMTPLLGGRTLHYWALLILSTLPKKWLMPTTRWIWWLNAAS